ncbi:hypothetical protein Aple_044650 [Acrocarpospora pleiomorpha]|uniref:Sugar ABC transporter substrate-binding protein n=1 Tax=Acrocarpospora pleiomorpha TaxID=90975 RepID=A0A5M3XN66_9ACTN|nr:sugar ABC transporter substrate-binding protein [Acrocarpospora pleiomorpha]GES21569.1 hypothetical protein Aple_044650 [Acrocarpospora pleiomorpha]
MSHRTFHRHLLTTLSLMLIGTLLTACGSGSGSADGVTRLTMWTFLDPKGDDPRGAALAKIVEGFNAANPKVRVEVTGINFAKIDGEVIRAAATGGGPDIVNVYSVQLAQHVAAGSVQPITTRVQPWLDKQGEEYVFPIDNVTYDKEIMALPWESRVWLLWYRKDILSEYGFEPPTTLAELSSVAAGISEKSGGKVAGIGIGMSEQGLGADFMEKFQPLTAHYGGTLFDSTGRAVFDDAAGQKALSYIKSLGENGALPRSSLTMSADDVVNSVKAGTVAMAIEGSYRVASTRAGEGVGENLVTAPVPGDPAGETTPTAVAGQTLAMGANTEHPDDVWRFMEYYLSASSQEIFAGAGVMPVLKSAYAKAPATGSVPAEELGRWRDYLLKDGRASRYPEDYSELSTEAVKAAQKVVFEGGDVASALQQVAKNYNANRN